MNWDVVAWPNAKEVLGKSKEVDTHLLMLSNNSKNKAQALQVMEYALSDEVQTMINKAGRVTVLENAEMQKTFAADLESMKGKNIVGIFKATPAKLHVPSEYDSLAKTKLTDAAKSVALKVTDVNTALREAQAATDKAIAEQMAAKK